MADVMAYNIICCMRVLLHEGLKSRFPLQERHREGLGPSRTLILPDTVASMAIRLGGTELTTHKCVTETDIPKPPRSGRNVARDAHCE